MIKEQTPMEWLKQKLWQRGSIERKDFELFDEASKKQEQHTQAKVLEAIEEIYSYVTTPLSKGEGALGEKYVRFPKKSEIEKKILELKTKQK